VPVFTAAALDSDPDGLALLHAVLHDPPQTESALAKLTPSWGQTADLKPIRPAARRSETRSGKRQTAARLACPA
jgi:hypothetical protein